MSAQATAVIRTPVARGLGLACLPFVPWGIYSAFFALHVWARSFGDEWLRWKSVSGLDRALMGGMDVPARLQAASGGALVPDFLGFLTHLSWFFVPVVIGIFLTVRRRNLLSSYFAWLLATFFLADIVFLLVPVVPPWMEGSAERTLLSRQFIEYTSADSNPVASMPSLHAALPLTMTIFCWHRLGDRRLATLLAAYSALVGLAVIYLGEHWVIDVLAGYALAGTVGLLFLHRRPRDLAGCLPGRPVQRLSDWNSRLFPDRAPLDAYEERARAA